MAVPAPEELDYDFDFFLEAIGSDDGFEDNDFEDLVEYLDNQSW